MQDPQRTPNMVQRRIICISIRAVLILLGVFLIWRMISTITDAQNSVPNIDSRFIVNSTDQPDPVNVDVYYESMCPDSKYFIIHQLVPTIQKISNFVNFRLIPYGKAQTYENATGIYFACQHKQLECEGNKIHACAIKHLKDNYLILKYNSCLFNNIRNPPNIAESCANQLGVDWEILRECASSKEGSELLKIHGEETNRLSPSVTFIPTILLNNSQGVQKDILKNLLKEVCNLLPGERPDPCY